MKTQSGKNHKALEKMKWNGKRDGMKRERERRRLRERVRAKTGRRGDAKRKKNITLEWMK